MKSTTLIIEDEPLSSLFLGNMLKTHHPDVQVLSCEHSVSRAIMAIEEKNPDLIFMDIELEGGTGFDVLRAVLPRDCYLIFTTALDEEVLNYLRICGLQFLPKPIDYLSLNEALQAFSTRKNSAFYQQILDNLRHTLHYNIPSPYLYHTEGTEEKLLLITDIIGIEESSSGTYLVLQSGIKINSNQPLKAYELLLSAYPFFRAHKDCLINIHAAAGLIPGASLSVKMKNGYRFPLSAKKKEALEVLLFQQNAMLNR